MRFDHDTEFDDLPDPRRWENRDSLFYWTVFILFLILFTIFCWVGSYFIFWHPEKAFSYNILKKLNKLEAPQKFELTAAPKGEFLDPKALLQRYGSLTPGALQAVNASLLRNFIRNYKQTRDLVPYVTGTYTILDSFELSPSNLFPSGVVALTQSTDLPMVLLENVFTSDQRVIPILHRTLLTGLNIRLEKRFDLSALVHITRLPDGRMLFTTLPILYGSYASNHGPGSFALTPPPTLNIKAGLPILSEAQVAEAEKAYIQYRQQTAPELASLKAKASKSPNVTDQKESPDIKAQLIRIEKPVVNVLPAEHVTVHNNPATSSPKRFLTSAPQKKSPKPPRAVPAPVASVEEIQIARALPAQAAQTATPFPSQPKETPETAATAQAEAAPTALPALPNSTPVTELPSSLASTAPVQPPPPSPSTPAVAFTNVASGNWQTYDPGQMPLGRLLEPSDVPQLADKGLTDERLYLKGNFLVTAARANRVVLRSQGNSLLGSPASKVRIIVEFPSNSTAPELGSTFSRGAQRPFLITDVQKAPGGMVNIFVREITHD